MQYNLPSGNGTTTYAAIVIKNMKWPGTTCVWKNGEFANIYVGNGIKFGGPIFIPVEPGLIVDEPEGLDEHIEPNPDKDPVIIESDSDKDPDDMDDADMD